MRIGGVVVGMIFLWIAASRTDPGAAFEAIKEADAVASTLVFLTALIFMWVKAVRWAYILKPVATVRFGLLHRLVYSGTAANILIPHSGELLRSTQLARCSPDPLFKGTALGTVAVERLLDFAALALLATVAIVSDPLISTWLWMAGLVAVLIVIGGVAFVVAVVDPDTPLKGIGTWIVERIPAHAGHRLHHHVYRGIEGLGTLRDRCRLLVALSLSLLQWSMVVLAIWISFRAVDEAVPLSAAIAVFVLTVIGLTLPSAPGQIGTTQLAFVAGLQFAGGATSGALAASLIYNLWFVLAMLAIGVVVWLATPK